MSGGKYHAMLYAVVVLVLSSLFAPVPVQAACSAWQGKAVLNEYYFGTSNPPGNFLEIYSGDPAFVAPSGQNWSIDVYAAPGVKTSYPLPSSTVTACVFGSKTYVTYSVPAGLVSSAALVILRDAGGSPVDALVFDNNKNIPSPWPAAATGYYPALAGECPALSATLDTQATNYKTTFNQQNMLQIANYGNKDIARFPDGSGDWSISGLQGAGTTYSQCSTNNTTLNKTANVATVLPGGTVVYTVQLVNNDNQQANGVVISDPVPSNWSFTQTVSVGTVSVSGQTITWYVGNVAVGSSATMTVTATVPAAAATGVYTNTASSVTPATSSSAVVTVVNPLPVTTGISPASANVGAAAFTMTVSGSNFVPGSMVRIGGVALTTTYISATQLSVTIAASYLTTAATYAIDVVNPQVNSVGGGTSNAQLFSVGNPVGSFNAFESATGANAISGVIRTKIAGSAFSLDVVAISSGAKAAGFSAAVKVELLGNSVSGVALDGNNCPASSTLLQTVTPAPAISGGRSSVSFAAVANAWKDVRVRVSYPAVSPTVISCSTDNFAIRPDNFSLSVSDSDWQTAGTTRMLANTTANGGIVHKAGQVFTLQMAAYNAGATITANYTDTPVAVLTACGGTACTATFGTFSGGGAAAVAGVINSTNATYSEAGSFALQMQDQNFAAVDAADGSTADCAGRYVCSATLSVGRFVPDHFDTLVTGPLLCPAGLTCPAGGMVYSGQSFSGKVTAKNAAGLTTQNYDNALGLAKALTLSAWDAAGGATTNPGGGTLTLNTVAATSFNGGIANTAVPVYTLAALQSLPADIYVRAAEPLALDGVTSLRGVASVEGGVKVVNGRIKISNAYGSETLPMAVSASVQFLNPSGSWVNSTSDSLNILTAAMLARGNCQGKLLNAGVCSAALGTISSVTSAAPLFSINLAAPGAGNAGSEDLTANTAGWPVWLPSTTGRATFGVYKGSGNLIYQRENY